MLLKKYYYYSNEKPKINVESLLQKIQQNDSIKLVGENKIRFDLTSNNIADYKRNIEEVFLTISSKNFRGFNCF